MLFQMLHFLKKDLGLVGFVLFSLWVIFLVILDMAIGALDFGSDDVVIPPPPPVVEDKLPPSEPTSSGFKPEDDHGTHEETAPPDPSQSDCLNIEGTVICDEG